MLEKLINHWMDPPGPFKGRGVGPWLGNRLLSDAAVVGAGILIVKVGKVAANNLANSPMAREAFSAVVKGTAKALPVVAKALTILAGVTYVVAIAGTYVLGKCIAASQKG